MYSDDIFCLAKQLRYFFVVMVFIKGFKHASKGHIKTASEASRDGGTNTPSIESKASVVRVIVMRKFVRMIKPNRIVVTEVDCEWKILADIRSL